MHVCGVCGCVWECGVCKCVGECVCMCVGVCCVGNRCLHTMRKETS